MTPDAALTNLLSATRQLVRTNPVLDSFVGAGLDDLTYSPPTPRDLAVSTRLGALLPKTSTETADLTAAIIAAAPHLTWQQSYTEAQVGAHYLANYGWFNLSSPEGPFLSDALRVSVGYWEQGLSYPQHSHAPEEIYCVLAGGARFESEGRAPAEAEPPMLIHHRPNQWHGFSMHSQPLLAMAFWKGDGLLDISTLEAKS